MPRTQWLDQQLVALSGNAARETPPGVDWSLEDVVHAPQSNTEGQPTRSLRRDFATSFVGNAAYAASQWALLIIIARLGSPEMVGQYSLALAVTAPVIMFTNLRLASLLASDAQLTTPLARYASVRLWSSIFALAVIAGIAEFGGYERHLAVVILGLGLARFWESFIDLTYGFLGRLHAFRAIALSLILRAVVSVTAVGAAAALTRDVAWVAFALAATWLALLAGLDLPQAFRVARGHGRTEVRAGLLVLIRRMRPDARTVQLVIMALPLGFVALALSLVASIPRFFIQNQLGDAALGYFSAAAYVVVGGRLLALALGTVSLPRLGVHFASQDRAAFARVLIRLLLFGLALGATGVIGALALGRQFLGAIYGADYAAYAPVLVWLLAASGLGYISTFLQDALTAMRRLRTVALVVTAAVATVTIGCMLSVPRFGLMGAALAIFGGSVVELAGSAAGVLRAQSGSRN